MSFIGTIKWRENKPITLADYNALTASGAAISGVGPTTRTVAVTRPGADERALAAFDVFLGPDEILGAWS